MQKLICYQFEIIPDTSLDDKASTGLFCHKTFRLKGKTKRACYWIKYLILNISIFFCQNLHLQMMVLLLDKLPNLCIQKLFTQIFEWSLTNFVRITAQKMKFSVKDFFSKCDQIRRKTSFFVQWFTLVKRPALLMFPFKLCDIFNSNFKS